jgi:hypothetical protein
MFDYLISPKVFAVSCTINGSQLTAEKLYLKEEFNQPTETNLFDDDINLIASVIIPKTDIQTHSNITLQIC